MKERVISKGLRLTLNVVMVVLVMALVLSFFFPAIHGVSKGTGLVPADLYLLDYLTTQDVWLILSFVFSILTIFSGVALIIVTCLEVVGVIKHNKCKDIVGIIILVTAILAIVFSIVYCAVRTPYKTNTSEIYLKYFPSWSMYVILICGFFAGIMALLDSPILRNNKK